MNATLQAQKVHAYRLTVLEGHLDTFGHVNNAVYLSLLEEARWDLITTNGYGLDQIKQSGKGPVILEINIKFLRELKLREEIVIETRLQSYEKRIGVMIQEIKNDMGAVCTYAELKFGLFDTVARRLISPTQQWLRAIGSE
ncbi:MAG: acyl-CoA thioesterase [Bdellovibrionota bacterium]